MLQGTFDIYDIYSIVTSDIYVLHRFFGHTIVCIEVTFWIFYVFLRNVTLLSQLLFRTVEDHLY
jgi:hypothetical protein